MKLILRKTTAVSHTTKLMVLSLFVVMITLFQFRHLLNESYFNSNMFNSNQSAGMDLDQIKSSGKLKVLVVPSSTSYFVYKGETMGYEYEMINLFAKHLGVKPEFIVATDLNLVYEELLQGKYDIVTSTTTLFDKGNKIALSEAFYKTQQVLVQKKPAGWQHMAALSIDSLLIRTVEQLSNKKIAIRKNTVYYAGIGNVASTAVVEDMPGNSSSEDIIRKVACGEVEYTIALKEIAGVNSIYFPDLDVRTVLKEEQNMTWATRISSKALLGELNKWIKTNKNKSKFNYLYNKYYADLTSALARYYSDNHSVCSSQISQYDELIKPYSKMMQWDWRLMASMICQESRFNPDARSFMGARGLMQLMPATAFRFGIDSVHVAPVENIKAGTKYLLTIDEYWQQSISDNEERQKFVLASYNVGLGHVIDARRLAEKHSCNPKLWEDVSTYLLLLSKPEFYNDKVVRHGQCRGEEPYEYVQKIFERYNHYRNLYEPGYKGEMLAGKITDQSYKGLIASYKKKIKLAQN